MRQLPNRQKKYFNPRSHEGSDHSTARRSFSSSDFNPRSHEGSDHFSKASITASKISIHAPTKGATGKKLHPYRRLGFQSTLPRRERPISVLINIKLRRFQSTLPRRERHQNETTGYQTALISIHAPTKGATFENWSDGNG